MAVDPLVKNNFLLHKDPLWLARLSIGLVTLLNLQCALVFILWPQSYAPGFELSGVSGAGMLRGMGILFVMWNVPYLVALWHPAHHRLSLYEAMTMQAVGVVGESLILFTLPVGHPILGASLARFIFFDGGGLILLLFSNWLISHRED
jgi:hypothetical protein